jgi:hypothetical protein
LIGTAGVGTFPAEAAPGNGVSLAEVLRAIHADVTGLNGDAMRGTDSASTHSAADVWTSGTRTLTAGTNLNDLSAAEVNAEVDSALNTAIPGSPTAGSLNDVIKDLDARLPASGTLSTFDETAAMTESYASDGGTFTLAQALYMIWSAVSEFGISGTTLTCRQLDGSTTAMTFTLDDSSNPTDRTRAT